MWDEQSHIYLAGRLRLCKPRVGPWGARAGSARRCMADRWRNPQVRAHVPLRTVIVITTWRNSDVHCFRPDGVPHDSRLTSASTKEIWDCFIRRPPDIRRKSPG